MPEVQPAVQYADLRQQDHAARLGMWGFLSTEVLFLGGLMLMYVSYRMAYEEGFVEAAHSTPSWAPHVWSRSSSGRLHCLACYFLD